MRSFDFQPRTRVVFGAGMIDRLGELARELNFKRTLLVADHGLLASGHVDEAVGPLEKAGVEVFRFHDFEVNPDTRMIEAGTAFVSSLNVDSIIGLGGGSSLDCAKGINFLHTNGGRMSDYRGYGKATKPMLPMVAIPTTAGTGSEAQSYALISDADSHIKMACGDPESIFPRRTARSCAHRLTTAKHHRNVRLRRDCSRCRNLCHHQTHADLRDLFA